MAISESMSDNSSITNYQKKNEQKIIEVKKNGFYVLTGSLGYTGVYFYACFHQPMYYLEANIIAQIREYTTITTLSFSIKCFS